MTSKKLSLLFGIALLFFASSERLSAQEDKLSEWEYKGIGFNVGYAYQHSSYAEASILFYKGGTTLGAPLGFGGWTLGSEFRLDKHFVIAPKVSYTIMYWMLAFRASAAYHTDFSEGGLTLCPEAGVTDAGVLYLMMGYNFLVYRTHQLLLP